MNSHILSAPNSSSNSLANVILPPSGVGGTKKKEKAENSRTLNGEHLIGISNELNQLKDSFKSVDNTRDSVPERVSTHAGGYLRSPSYERMSLGSNYKKTNTSRGLSPTNKVTKSTTTSLSSSRISAPANMPDLNMLDVLFLFQSFINILYRVNSRIQEGIPLQSRKGPDYFLTPMSRDLAIMRLMIS